MRNTEGLGDVFLGKEKVRKWLMLCLFVCVFVFKVAYFGVERMHSGARLPGSKSQTLSLKSCMIFSKTVLQFSLQQNGDKNSTYTYIYLISARQDLGSPDMNKTGKRCPIS